MPFSVSQKSLCNNMLFSAVQVSVKHILLETKKKKKIELISNKSFSTPCEDFCFLCYFYDM